MVKVSLCGAAACLWLGAVSFAAGSCQSYSDYCTEKMDCEGGNDADIQACEVDMAAKADEASLYGCSEWWGVYFECLAQNADCDHDNYGLAGDDCEEESADYHSCK